ncbi:MAG: hypothetical protein U0559_10565 [Anaerolineae bacterium]
MPDELDQTPLQVNALPTDLQRLRNILYSDHARRLEQQLADMTTRLDDLHANLIERSDQQAAQLATVAADFHTRIQSAQTFVTEQQHELHTAFEARTAVVLESMTTQNADMRSELIARNDRLATALAEIRMQLQVAQTALADRITRDTAALQQHLDRSDQDQAARLEHVESSWLARLDRLEAALTAWLEVLQSATHQRFDQQAAQLEALQQTLSAQLMALAGTQRQIVQRLDQHSASLVETHRLLLDSVTRLTRLLDDQREVLRATVLDHVQQHEATWLTAQQAQFDSTVRLADRLNAQARANYDELNRRVDKITARLERASNDEHSTRRKSPTRPKLDASAAWADDIRSWRPCAKDPKLAAKFVRFMQRAIEQLPDRAKQAAWFGVHTDRITLTVGNLVLASITARERSVALLVDRDWDQVARLTEAHTPLGWHVIGWSQLARLNDAKQVWLKYQSAADKIWDAPAARLVIKRNLRHKRRVSTLFSGNRA